MVIGNNNNNNNNVEDDDGNDENEDNNGTGRLNVRMRESVCVRWKSTSVPANI